MEKPKLCHSAHFSSKTANSAARLKVPGAVENCGVNVSNRSSGLFCRTSTVAEVWQNRPNGSQLVYIRQLFDRLMWPPELQNPHPRLKRLAVMQQTCFVIASAGYVVTVNKILVCEYVTECNVTPPGVRKLNKQALDFGYVVTVKLNSGVQIQRH